MELRNTTSETIDHLNSFLRGEIAAVETYHLALGKMNDFAYRSTIEQCAHSHERRVSLLRDEIRRRGGHPSDGAGPWGFFTKVVEGGAAVIGEKAAIAALEEGEDHGKNDYLRDTPTLEPTARQFVESQLLPEQLRTHRAMSTIKNANAHS